MRAGTMSAWEFAKGELRCGRLPWFALEIWVAGIFGAALIAGAMYAGFWIGAGIDEAIHAKAEICRSWINK